MDLLDATVEVMFVNLVEFEKPATLVADVELLDAEIAPCVELSDRAWMGSNGLVLKTAGPTTSLTEGMARHLASAHCWRVSCTTPKVPSPVAMYPKI
jgi:hypothetical protein